MIPRTHAIVSFLTLAAGYAAEAQIQFVDQTTTRFPVQAEYTNQIGVADIDADGDLDMCFANGQGY